MTWVEVSPGGHCQILGAGAAAGNSFIDAGAGLQVDHIMIKSNGLSVCFTLQHIFGQNLVVLHDRGHVGFGNGIGISRGTNHRFHAEFGEA
ncbi:hypothetical protein SDC9_76984 [bioreactor metagenome]|uniref:Uncharacterized protein n=1 Tax=bioreactor metagenome TaxID=1076179 RepID=A0A644YWP7_9ZZZZ